MEAENTEKLMYPVGKFQEPAIYTSADIDQWISDLEKFPALLQKECNQITQEMLDEPYRQGGWTTRQVIHHLADSHMNAFIRFKLTLTENLPRIRPYNEKLFAELYDGKQGPVEVSIALLDSVHKRFVIVLRNMKMEEFDRKYFHPGNNREYTLKTALALYAWHCKHHLEHIRIVKNKFAGAER
jgi:hypothetical protein